MSKPAKWMRDAAAVCHASDCVFVEHDECGPDIDLLADVIARHYAPTQQAVDAVTSAAYDLLRADTLSRQIESAARLRVKLAELEKLDGN